MDRADHDTHYIDGVLTPAASPDRIEVRDATTEEVIGSIPAGTAAEVDLAEAAKEASQTEHTRALRTSRRQRERARAQRSQQQLPFAS